MDEAALRLAAKQYRLALRVLDAKKRDLYAQVAEARATGLTLREVGKIAGLSHSRIDQITKPRSGEEPQ